MFVRFSNLAVSSNKTPNEIVTGYPTDLRVKNFNTFIKCYPVLVDRVNADRFIFDILMKLFCFFSSCFIIFEKA